MQFNVSEDELVIVTEADKLSEDKLSEGKLSEDESESTESDVARSPSPMPRRMMNVVSVEKTLTTLREKATFGLVTRVVKRGGKIESVKVSKIQERIDRLARQEPKLRVDVVPVVQAVVSSLCNGVTTQELDQVAIKAAANLGSTHPDFDVLASRIAVSNMHKTTRASFYETMKSLSNNCDKNGTSMPLLSDEFMAFVETHKEEVEAEIKYSRDYLLSHFAIATLERSYLLQSSEGVRERPQHLFMREAIRVGAAEWRLYYERLSKGYFTHATPTMFNSGTPNEQLSSCFLVSMSDDSIEGIYETLKECALISKGAGGIGIDVCNIRAKGSRISGGGFSTGLVPMLQVYEKTAGYVDQGGGKRKGAFAIYLEPWHPDVFDVLAMKDPQTPVSMQGLDLFLGMWIPDLFMKRVEESAAHRKAHPTDMEFANWSLFCPRDAPGLHEAYGDEFEALYAKYESEGLTRRRVDAMSLMQRIIQIQVVSGVPYMLYKDTVNKLSNQQHLGPIRLSNLCTEIVEYTEPGEEIAVCNLVSIALPRFVRSDKTIDYDDLGDVVRMAVRSLNHVIDINAYPVEKSKKSNLRHRPIGIGVQGMADLFIAMGLPFESDEAIEANRKIFETMYFHAVSESCELAKTMGKHESFDGSPLSRGRFHWQLHQDVFDGDPISKDANGDELLPWGELRTNVCEYGTRNSLFIAPMPTASTAQILGNSEGLEAIQSMIFSRKVLSGEFQVVNGPLLECLISKGLWNDDMRRSLIRDGGSVQNLQVDDSTKALFKTAWEIKQRRVLDMASARAPFIDQSASLNIYVRTPEPNIMFNIHMYGWKAGLKTGMYYLRSQSEAQASRAVINSAPSTTLTASTTPSTTDNSHTSDPEEAVTCRKMEGCVMCGS